MNGMVIKEGEFPHHRKTSCCGKLARPGESVILVEKRLGGAVKGHNVLHKRCLEQLCETLPTDACDSRKKLKELRARIQATGNPFPDNEIVGPKRGERVKLAS